MEYNSNAELAEHERIAKKIAKDTKVKQLRVTMSDSKLSQTQVADKVGVRPSTIKYYTQLALLPYEQNGAGGHRRYDLQAVTERLELLHKLKAKGLTMNDIIKKLAKEGKLYGDPDLFAINLTGKAK
jgi:hypothetical protein